MSQFEVITITLSFVLGLSMSHLLWAAAAAVRARRDLRLRWLPFLWAACIFFVHVQYWFAAFAINTVIDQWTWSWYLQMLALGVLLFASGALVLPSESQQRSGDLLDDFRERWRPSGSTPNECRSSGLPPRRSRLPLFGPACSCGLAVRFNINCDP